jgi:hypothetical protein
MENTQVTKTVMGGSFTQLLLAILLIATANFVGIWMAQKLLK